jgi:hypothetical protein
MDFRLKKDVFFDQKSRSPPIRRGFKNSDKEL